MPLVSIVLPAYKGEYFEAALVSLLGQTFRDFELIVVDDASPFDFRDVMGRHPDSRLRFYRNETNLGRRSLVEAWNRALSYATGEFAVLASDDDCYQPEYVEEMVRLARENPEVALFSCRVGHIDSCGELRSPGVPVLPHESPAYFVWMRERWLRHQTAPEFFFRMEAFRRIGSFVDFPVAWFTDNATWYSLAAYQGGGVVSSPRMLFTYRDSNEQLSSVAARLDDKFEAMLIYLGWFETFRTEVLSKTLVSHEDRACYGELAAGHRVRMKRMFRQAIRHASWPSAIRMARVLATRRICSWGAVAYYVCARVCGVLR